MEARYQEQAKETIATADQHGAIYIMIGLPLDSDPPYDPKVGAITNGKCSRCGRSVKSTEFYDAILSLTADRPIAKRPALLCEDCHKTFVHQMTPGMLPHN